MTFETGEDFHISHTMRKYANIGTYVMPYNSKDDETKGSKFRGLSFVNAATTSSDVPLRDQLWMGALKAGSRMRWMDMFTAEEAHVDPAALLVIRTEADVRALLPLVSHIVVFGVVWWRWRRWVSQRISLSKGQIIEKLAERLLLVLMLVLMLVLGGGRDRVL